MICLECGVDLSKHHAAVCKDYWCPHFQAYLKQYNEGALINMVIEAVRKKSVPPDGEQGSAG